METLGETSLKSFLADGWQEQNITNFAIRKDPGLIVRTFPELVDRIAQLAYHNRDHVLLFRGQSKEHRDNEPGITTLQPKIFHPLSRNDRSSWMSALSSRYRKLKHAERLLISEWSDGNLPDDDRIRKHRNIRWAILQHYEVCGTPFLDVTHSLRVAASFAANAKQSGIAMLYVLAVPQISGAITASAEAEIQILRLASICPPQATRPHFQEGYLLGHYPDLDTVEEKELYRLFQVDFAKRLLCKFRLDLTSFWTPDFQPVPAGALYPKANDPLLNISKRIERAIR